MAHCAAKPSADACFLVCRFLQLHVFDYSFFSIRIMICIIPGWHPYPGFLSLLTITIMSKTAEQFTHPDTYHHFSEFLEIMRILDIK